MFMLVWEWTDEKTGFLYEQRVDWFDTKKELIEAYHNARMEYIGYINNGRLLLSAAINYPWSYIAETF